MSGEPNKSLWFLNHLTQTELDAVKIFIEVLRNVEPEKAKAAAITVYLYADQRRREGPLNPKPLERFEGDFPELPEPIKPLVREYRRQFALKVRKVGLAIASTVEIAWEDAGNDRTT